MILSLQDFKNPWINPNQAFRSDFAPDEFLVDAALDPALALENLDLPGDQIARYVARGAINSVLMQQQYLVYDISSQVGVLAPYVGVTEAALQAFDVIVKQLSTDVVAAEAINSVIGACGSVLSAIPTIYTQIAGAIISLSSSIASIVMGNSTTPPREILPCQEWSEETDEYQFNKNFRAFTSSGYDWTGIFAPRYEGQLSMKICRGTASGRMAWVWGFGNGEIVHLGESGGNYTFSEDGTFIAAGGLGMIPGGQQIYSLYQSSLVNIRNRQSSQIAAGGAINVGEPGNKWGHPMFGDPRCGDYDIVSVDIGKYYPTSAQAAVSLWCFLFQRGAATYAVNPYELSERWSKYFIDLWDGVEGAWGKSFYEGKGGIGSDSLKEDGLGWGRQPWRNSLSDLLINHGVGAFGNIGDIGTYSPDPCQAHLTENDQEAFWTGSVLGKIIIPALGKLAMAQAWYLDNTTMAAYLPIEGGKDANPLQQPTVMGAFGGTTDGSKVLRKKFVDARNRILNGAQKHEVRLDDVLDPVYRQQISAAGGGTGTQAFGITAKPPLDQLAWTPTGGAGYEPPTNPPSEDGHTGLIVAGSAVALGGLAWWFRDDVRRVVLSARERVRSRLGRGR